MKQYKIYKHPTIEAEAVKVGWSWPAFSFFGIWAFVKKLWMVGMASFFILGSVGFLLGMGEMASKGSFSGDARETTLNICVFMGMLLFGFKGNAWLEEDLSSRGYEYTGTVTAASTKEAINQTPAT